MSAALCDVNGVRVREREGSRSFKGSTMQVCKVLLSLIEKEV